MRGRSLVFTMMFLLFGLLALSSLIEAPLPEEPAPAAASGLSHVALLPAALPSREASASLTPVSRLPLMTLAALLAGTNLTFPTLNGRDQNGRWVLDTCYVSSVYLLFRQEKAAG